MMDLIIPPTCEPVTIDDAKLALRIDDTAFDAVLPGLISAAREQAEHITGRAFMRQTRRAELADWPAATDVFPVHRATAVVVSYWDGSAWASLAGSAFAFAANGGGTSIAPAVGAAWPALGAVAIGPRVRVDITAGLAAADAFATPEAVRAFVVALVGQMLDAPELPASDTVEANPLLCRLLDPWRVYE